MAMSVTLHITAFIVLALICSVSSAAALFEVRQSCCGKLLLPGPQVWLPI